MWSSRNKLKLNESKTEILQVTSQFRQPTPLPNNCIVNDISPSTSVRDLGVVIDHELNLQKHINNTCRSAAFGICKIGKLRRFLDQANTERLAHAFVTTHLDYCNSLYVNLPQTHIAPPPPFSESRTLQLVSSLALRNLTTSPPSFAPFIGFPWFKEYNSKYSPLPTKSSTV